LFRETSAVIGIFSGIVSSFHFDIVVSVQYIYKFSRTFLVPSWAITTKNPAALLRHVRKENVSY